MTQGITYHHEDAVSVAKTLGAPLVHGCNAMGVMGSGFAAMVRKMFPEAEAVYLRQYRNAGLELGSYTFAESNGVIIVNLVTQWDTSAVVRKTDYEAMAKGFEALNSELKTAGVKDVVMPAIGADLGGGSWRVIEALLVTYFADVRVHVCYIDADRWEKIKST